MEHRGEIIETAIRNSGISLTTIAKRLGKTRQWLYLLFDNPNAPIDVIISIGKIIFHDFSKEIQILNSTIKSEAEFNASNSSNDNKWKEKYFLLLEEHLDLLKRISDIEKKLK
ncbi:MAG: hypothetical protein KA264_07620 [Crocinitomicaceae bacterium]|nr:hypothetical protein [Crocinitomicaceae bacterium]